MSRSVENLAKRKGTGGRRIPYRERRAHERDSFAVETILGKGLILKRRARGGGIKLGLRRAEYVNVFDPATKKASRVKILKVSANPASQDYKRKRIITKGAEIETELGRARVVSRPSQDGVLNAILISSKSL